MAFIKTIAWMIYIAMRSFQFSGSVDKRFLCLFQFLGYFATGTQRERNGPEGLLTVQTEVKWRQKGMLV